MVVMFASLLLEQIQLVCSHSFAEIAGAEKKVNFGTGKPQADLEVGLWN
jgi:hypothetical protein